MISHQHLATEMNRAQWMVSVGPEVWHSMLAIREIESRLADYIKRGYIAGSTHQSVGMEAVAVGVSMSLRRTDLIASNHRGHAHCLAKGAAPERLLAELFGRATGYCGGKGGSMLIAAPELGILGTDAIVGASIGIATGAALAAQVAGNDTVAVAYFGDGAVNEGIFHEALNLAAVWRLPCVFVCENNHYAKSCAVETMVPIPDVATRAAAYGMPGINVDGMDAYAVWAATRIAVAQARNGLGPSLVVADTYRMCGHSVGDTEIYRTECERDQWQARDPIATIERDLRILGVIDAEVVIAAREEVRQYVDTAEAAALAAPLAPIASARYDVYGSRAS